jgi:hypothetical protein
MLKRTIFNFMIAATLWRLLVYQVGTQREGAGMAGCRWAGREIVVIVGLGRDGWREFPQSSQLCALVRLGGQRAVPEP